MVREPLRGALGVRPVLNAAATLTAIGGSVMPPEVLDAMVKASVSHVDMHELHVAAGRELAALTRNEGAYVTCGAASAIAHALLACVTHGDPALIADMPGGDGLPTDVVVHCAHRIPYDRFIDLVGCRAVQIGNAIQTFEWELERALSPRTAAVLWVAGGHLPQAAISLERTIEIAHAHGVPVIVDAAAQLPPPSNLWYFTRDLGADLVAFSGGKALRGPQASGLLLGRSDLIEAARANGAPNQRLLRALKVGKEEIGGLVAAVRRYVELDHDALVAGWGDTVDAWAGRLSGHPGIDARRVFPNEAGQPTPRLRVRVDPAVVGRSTAEIIAALWDLDPRVAVLPGQGEEFFMTPDTLGEGEADIVVDAVERVIADTQRHAAATAPGERAGL